MRKILTYLKEYKKECFFAPLFKLLEASFELIVPLVMAAIIDRGISGADHPFIFRMGGVLILLAAVGFASAATAQYFAAKAAVGFSTKLRHVLFEKIESLSFSEIVVFTCPITFTCSCEAFATSFAFVSESWACW